MEHKLLFVASSYIHILNFHLPYLHALADRGWIVHAACAAPESDIPYAARTLSIPFVKQMRSPDNIRAAGMLRRLIREEGYELIITHTSLAAFFTRLALWGLRRRPKLINMVHGYLFDAETPFFKRQLLLAAERLTAPQTDLLLTMNHWDYDLARRWRLGRKVMNLPGIGVDFSRFERVGQAEADRLRDSLGLPKDAFVLLCAAELSSRKSQSVLLAALKLLPERAVLILAGTGAEKEKLEAMTERLGLSGRVLFPGYVRGLSAWYAMADAVVTASRSEGLPFNVMEAMYLARPVVASAVKGHTDLLRDGVSGLLVPYGDAAACAAAVRRLMEEPGLSRRLTERAAEDLDVYSLDEVLPQVMSAYESVADIPEPVTQGG